MSSESDRISHLAQQAKKYLCMPGAFIALFGIGSVKFMRAVQLEPSQV